MRRIYPILLLSALISASAAFANPELPMHSFGFNAVIDSPDVEILNFRYGNSKQPGARPPDGALAEGRVAQGASTTGEMLRGDELYVKWKIRKTEEVYEDTVDLRTRLPANIKNHRIYFITKGPQLYVYLITPNRRQANEQPNGPRQTQYLKTITIYPDSAK